MVGSARNDELGDEGVTDLLQAMPERQDDQLFEKCVELNVQAHGADDPDLGPKLSHLGQALGKLGKHAEAEQTLLRGISLMRQASEHRLLDNALNALGQLYLSLGRYDAAKDLLLEAFELREPQLDENSIHLIDTGLALGIAYQALEMPEEANRRLEGALRMMKSLIAHLDA